MTDAAKTVPIASFAIGADGAARVRVPLPADPNVSATTTSAANGSAAGRGIRPNPC